MVWEKSSHRTLRGLFHYRCSAHQKLYLPANSSTQMASSARYIDAASGTPTTATTIDEMISASETTDEVRCLI